MPAAGPPANGGPAVCAPAGQPPSGQAAGPGPRAGRAEGGPLRPDHLHPGHGPGLRRLLCGLFAVRPPGDPPRGPPVDWRPARRAPLTRPPAAGRPGGRNPGTPICTTGWVADNRRDRPVPIGAAAMPITLNCPKCHKPFRVRDESIGGRVRCPSCGAVLQVPCPVSGLPLRGRPAAGGRAGTPGPASRWPRTTRSGRPGGVGSAPSDLLMGGRPARRGGGPEPAGRRRPAGPPSIRCPGAVRPAPAPAPARPPALPPNRRPRSGSPRPRSANPPARRRRPGLAARSRRTRHDPLGLLLSPWCSSGRSATGPGPSSTRTGP